jgi:superfamily II DNA/RNA helicase
MEELASSTTGITPANKQQNQNLVEKDDDLLAAFTASESSVVPPNNWKSLGLLPWLIAQLNELNLRGPTPVQVSLS